MKTLYHGSTVAVEHPLVQKGRRNLDFGQGFYVTDMVEQARKWAERVSRQRIESPVISVYEFDEAYVTEGYLLFQSYDISWLEFIVKCRNGFDASSLWNVVEGGVANDRVIDTVEGYINGTIDAEHALAELSKHKPNNQLCFLNQMIIDKYVKFKGTI